MRRQPTEVPGSTDSRDTGHMHLAVFDLDGALDAQTSLCSAAPWASVCRVPLRDLAPRLRLWSRAHTIAQARARLAAVLPEGPTLGLLGSGDFHHLAVLLMERVVEPYTIVHLDNHPDWVRLAPRWHCGAWVNRALELRQVRRVITLGPCSDDLVRPDRKGGNLAALAAGRIVLFPWRHAPSRVCWRIADGPGHRYRNGYLVWRNLADQDLDVQLDAILSLIDTEAVWLSIDKDVLREADALTNWDQGEMPLEVAARIVTTVGARRRIVGADVCGDYSPAQHRNWCKRIEALLDQPARGGIDTAIVARNEVANRELLRAIQRATGAC